DADPVAKLELLAGLERITLAALRNINDLLGQSDTRISLLARQRLDPRRFRALARAVRRAHVGEQRQPRLVAEDLQAGTQTAQHRRLARLGQRETQLLRKIAIAGLVQVLPEPPFDEKPVAHLL